MRSLLTFLLLTAPLLGQGGSATPSGGSGTATPAKGLLVTVARGPAREAGLNAGDTITSIHGVPWEARSESEWMRVLAGSSQAERIRVTFVRDDRQREVEVQPEWTLATSAQFPRRESARQSADPRLAPNGSRLEVKSQAYALSHFSWLGSQRKLVLRSTSVSEELTASWTGGPRRRAFRCSGETSIETSDGSTVRWTGEGWIFWNSHQGFFHIQFAPFDDPARAVFSRTGWGMTLVDREVEARCDPRLQWLPAVEWGFGGGGLKTRSIREHKSRPISHGVIVYAVQRESPSERAGVLAGDVIVDVNGKSVATAHELFGIMSSSYPDQLFKMRVRRGEQGALRSLTIRAELKYIPDRMTWEPVQRSADPPVIRTRGLQQILQGSASGTIHLEFPPGALDVSVSGDIGAIRSSRVQQGRLADISYAMRKSVTGSVSGKRTAISLRADYCDVYWRGLVGSEISLAFGANKEKASKRRTR